MMFFYVLDPSFSYTKTLTQKIPFLFLLVLAQSLSGSLSIEFTIQNNRLTFLIKYNIITIKYNQHSAKRFFLSCVILLPMKDMAPPLIKLLRSNSTLTDEDLSFILFYSTIQHTLYSYTSAIHCIVITVDTLL